MKKDTALWIMLLGGFITLFVDIRFEHRDVLNEMWQGYIPLVAAGVGALAVVLALLKKNMPAALLLALVTLTGFGGLYFHTKFRPYMFTRYIVPMDENSGPNGTRLKGWERPTLAPLAFTAFGLMGLINLKRR